MLIIICTFPIVTKFAHMPLNRPITHQIRNVLVFFLISAKALVNNKQRIVMLLYTYLFSIRIKQHYDSVQRMFKVKTITLTIKSNTNICSRSISSYQQNQLNKLNQCTGIKIYDFLFLYKRTIKLQGLKKVIYRVHQQCTLIFIKK